MVVKITRKLLDDYQKLKASIPVLEAELNEMQEGTNGFDHSVILNYKNGEAIPQAVVGFDWPLYQRRTERLEKVKAQVKAVEDWIEAIEDGQTRCVFRMYYINGMTWGRIAQKTGYSKSPDYPRKMIRDSYLKKCGIK